MGGMNETGRRNAAPVSLAKSYYVLALLTLVWAFQFANIQIVNIVLERIRN